MSAKRLSVALVAQIAVQLVIPRCNVNNGPGD